MSAGRVERRPAAVYLENLPPWDGEERFKRVATEILGAKPHKRNVERVTAFFIGAVARALDPGCKHDGVLILCGGQRKGKSNFFRVLGGELATNTTIDIRSNIPFVSFSTAWLWNLDEIDLFIGDPERHEAKGVLTRAEDIVRALHARGPVRRPRGFVVVGTANTRQFFITNTGSRRCWVVDVGHQIDLELLQAWRDQLWAEALTRYLEGHPWWLTRRKTNTTRGRALAGGVA